MKYLIEEIDKNGRFYYDEFYDSIEEAKEVIKEYQADDEEEPKREGIAYFIVDEEDHKVVD